MILMLTSCISKREIDSALFVHEQLPAEFCGDSSPIKKLGVYRIFDCTPNLVDAGICQPGQVRVRERIAYCKPEIKNFFGVKDSELAEILKKAGIK
jgi:hypothetical protein